MVSEKMEKALNGQLNAEVYSGYLYLSMAAYFEDEDLAGFANWMRVQAEEESLTAIEGPQTEWDSPLAAFEHVLSHEQMVTGLINDLVNLAIEEKDHATNNFLQWFVEEQVEEEENAMELLAKAKLADGDNRLIYELNKELGERTPTQD